MDQTLKIKKHKDDSSFYCGEKRCRKSAWLTPEYLTPDDWKNTRDAVAALNAKDMSAFNTILRRPGYKEAFFYRVIAWPEGARYYYQAHKPINYFNMIVQHVLPKLKLAMAEHDKVLNTPRPPQPDRLYGHTVAGCDWGVSPAVRAFNQRSNPLGETNNEGETK